MKLPDFRYACPASLDEALQLLGDAGGSAKPLAGGQSLLPTLAFRLAAPGLLVDLRKIPGLDRIVVAKNGVQVGASVRWCEIERHEGLRTGHPLLHAAIRHVAHYQIRNRGTVGGSLAHADPAAELPGIAVTCEAQIELASPHGRRSVPAEKFFTGALSTLLNHDELIVAVRFPPWPALRRWGFEELSRRRGDFAIAGVAVFFDLDAAGRAANTHVGVIGAADRPFRLRAAEAQIDGTSVDAASIARAAAAAMDALDPQSDLHASGAYRRALVGTLLERTLAGALAGKGA
ncbi:MAG TPA: xanthine dehydrogenase family protein subunit M [Burkholderiales bacterium]|nr:xanthine dehydrogenase family protein subunit M [Burkholderiales bacterium]